MVETAYIYDLIEEYRAKLGLSQAEVAMRAFGQNSSAAIQGLRRGKTPGIERLSAMSEVLGLELYFGPPRSPAVELKRTDQNVSSIPVEEFAFVQRFDVKLSAGPGQSGDNARKLAPVAFRKAWLREQGLRADGCVVTGIVGNSMEPLLFDGDLVLLNTQQTEVRSGQIYGIVDTEGDLRMKRIEKISEGIILRSENTDCPSELRLGDDSNRVRVIGALAWSGHSHAASRNRKRVGSF